MAAPPLHKFGPRGKPGEQIAEDDQLYVTPDEALAAYGVRVDAGQIRFAMSLIDSACKRTSLWIESYEEEIEVRRGGQGLLSYLPVFDIERLQVRPAPFRESDRAIHETDSYDYHAFSLMAQGVAEFVDIDLPQVSVNKASGQIWWSSFSYGIGAKTAIIRYSAGYESIPARVKAATINVVNNVCNRGPSNRLSHRAGGFSSTFQGGDAAYVDDATMRLLQDYIVRTYA